MKRNLFYNCYAAKHDPGVWRDNVEQLCKYVNTFNGRKVVVIKTGDELVDPEEVKQVFTIPGIEFRTWPNGPHHEFEGFMENLETFYSLDPNEITFYAHTKGSGKAHKKHLLEEHHIAIRQWRNRMYYECLGDFERIDAILSKYSAAGCFLRNNPRVETVHHWMFLGTFWWMNHRRFFSRQWQKNVRQERGWPEKCLSSVIPLDEAYSLYETREKYRLYHEVSLCYECQRGHKIFSRKRADEDEIGKNCHCGLPMIKKYREMTI